MDFAQMEMNVEDKAKLQVEQNPIELLSDFQLAIVGGGCGEVIFG